MAKKKKPKPILKGMFEFEVPIYDRWVAVFVGMNHKECIAVAKKQGYSKDFIESLKWEPAQAVCDGVADKDSQTDGAVCKVNDSHFFMFLRPFRNDWKYYDTLNHEVFHITQYMSQILTFWDENEPPAYLHSWMFKELRRKLSGLSK